MKKELLLLIFSFASIIASAQVTHTTRDKTIETKIGADFHFALGKTKKMSLTPSVRSVFSNSRQNEKMTSYQGMETELCYSVAILQWLTLNADMELDLKNKGNLEFSYYLSAAPKYKYKRFSVFGELKLSNNRNLSYFDKRPAHHFKYIAGCGFDVVENVISVSAKAIFPHDIKTNTFEKVQVKIQMNVVLTNHIGFNISYQRTEDFTQTDAIYTPAMNFVYTL